MHSFNDLSNFAKKIILNRLGISNKSEVDSVILDKYASLYFEELEGYESEDAYDTFLKDKITAVETDVRHKLAVVYTILKSNGIKISDAPKPINIKQLEKGKTYLRIVISDPLYEGFKYLVQSLYNLPTSSYEYIISVTNSKFLSLDSKLNEFITDKNIKYILTRDALKTAHIAITFLCPSHINENQLVFLNYSDIIFRMTKNITLEHLTEIYNSLVYNDLIQLNGFSIELLEITEINEDGTIKSVNQII